MIRICLTGAESTGKSTLAPRLAARFGGVVVAEYGRHWAETQLLNEGGTDFTPHALRAIAHGHLAARQAAEARHPRLIIEDTDIVTTGAWALMLHGHRDPALTAIPATADLYLLFAPDTPFVADGTRAFPGPERQRFDAALRAEFAARAITPHQIAGDWPAREAAAIAAIAERF